MAILGRTDPIRGITFTAQPAPVPPDLSMTVTATQTAGQVADGMLLRVVVLLGAAAVQNGGTASSDPSSPPYFDQQVTTTVTGSVVLGAVFDWYEATTFTADERTTFLDSIGDEVNGVTYGTFRATDPASTPGPAVYGAVNGGASGAFAAAEILPDTSTVIAVDPSSPDPVWTDSSQAVTTASFTPPPGALLVALIASDGGSSGYNAVQATPEGGGLTWVPLISSYTANPAATAGGADIWVASVPPPNPDDPQITATAGGSVAAGLVIRVLVLTGAAAAYAQTGGSGTQSGAAAHQVPVTTTQAGSRVYGAAVNGANTSFTPNAATTALDNVADATHGMRYGTFRAAAATGTPGTVTYGFSSPASAGGAAALEVLPASGQVIAEDGTAPPAASTLSSTAVTTAWFTPPADALLVALVSSDGGTGVTTMAVTGGGLSWAEKARSNTAPCDYAGVWVADVPDAALQAGTPAPARATSASVTGTWGTGQARAAGNLLVALVTGGGTTAAAWSCTTPAGWTQRLVAQNNAAGTDQCGIAVYTMTATGGDAAPSFTVGVSGTIVTTCTLFEFTGADLVNPIDASGVYQSGGSSGTLTWSASTTAAVPHAGGFGIAAFIQERGTAYGSGSWTEQGTGWSALYTDVTTSSNVHERVNTMAGVPALATLSDSGQFSTRSTSYGAGVVVVIRAAPPPPRRPLQRQQLTAARQAPRRHVTYPG